MVCLTWIFPIIHNPLCVVISIVFNTTTTNFSDWTDTIYTELWCQRCCFSSWWPCITCFHCSCIKSGFYILDLKEQNKSTCIQCNIKALCPVLHKPWALSTQLPALHNYWQVWCTQRVESMGKLEFQLSTPRLMTVMERLKGVVTSPTLCQNTSCSVTATTSLFIPITSSLCSTSDVK